MLLNRALDLLARAAAPTHDRIREEARSAPRRIRELLLHIDAHLFDPDLEVRGMFRACGIRDKSMSARFRQAVGLSPRVYIADCRLETASRLLRETELLITEIAGLLHYSTPSAFSNAFRGWSGQSPDGFRRAAHATLDRVGPADEELLASTFWRRAMEGKAEPETIERLIGRLRALYAGRLPREVPPEGSGAVLVDGGDYERFRAAEIWREIRHQPWELQVQAVRDKYRFTSAVLFEYLLARSREEGRQDRQRGVEIARLALESVQGSAPTLGAALPGLLARAWAWLGNAHRLALDFPQAEQAFARAEAEWSLQPEKCEPLVEGELFALKATLRLAQRRLDDAHDTQTRAIDAIRKTDDHSLLARALVQRATGVAYRGDAEDSLSDLHEALELAQAEEDPYLALSATASLACAYALASKPGDAEKLLPRAKGWCRRLSNSLVQQQLYWIEGLVCQARGDSPGTESLFIQARQGFLDLGEIGHAAFLSLELAALLSEQGRSKEVETLAAEALPVLASFRAQDEGLAALRLLQHALSTRNLTSAILRSVSKSLRLLLQSALLHG